MMATPSRIHQKISMEFSRQLANFLEGKKYEVYDFPDPQSSIPALQPAGIDSASQAGHASKAIFFNFSLVNKIYMWYG